MVEAILTAAGFVKNETYRETRFLKPPNQTYAVYNDNRTIRGADYLNLVTAHNVGIELYEYAPDPDAEQRLENQFDAFGLEYIKQPRYYLNEEQLYQVIYEISYTLKKKGA